MTSTPIVFGEEVGVRNRSLKCGSLVDQKTGLEWIILSHNITKNKVAARLNTNECGGGWRAPKRAELQKTVMTSLFGHTEPVIWTKQGRSYKSTGLGKSALVGLRSFRKSRILKSLRTKLNKGRVKVRAGRYDRGRAYYREALEIDPTHPTVLNELAYAYYLDARSSEADHREGLKLSRLAAQYARGDKLVRLIYTAQGRLLEKLGDDEQALAVYERTLPIGGGASAQRRIAEIRQKVALRIVDQQRVVSPKTTPQSATVPTIITQPPSLEIASAQALQKAKQQAAEAELRSKQQEIERLKLQAENLKLKQAVDQELVLKAQRETERQAKPTAAIQVPDQSIESGSEGSQGDSEKEQFEFLLNGLWIAAAFFLQRLLEKLLENRGYAMLTVCAIGFLLAFFTANYFLLGGSVLGGSMGSASGGSSS
jgi:tetratricopeptide (TPR) repeat protein